MEEKNVAEFKRACREYFTDLGLTVLRTYGRYLGLRTPTMMKKEALIEEIIGVLCGEIEQAYTLRGAPIKNYYLAPGLIKYVEFLKEKYLLAKDDVEPIEPPPTKSLQEKPKTVYSMISEENEQSSYFIIFAGQKSALTEKQKALLNELING